MTCLEIDDFALKCFQLSKEGAEKSNEADRLSSKIQVSLEQFTAYVDKCVKEYEDETGKKYETMLADGYAPFCKHLIIPNIFPVFPSSIEITDAIAQNIIHGYSSRRPEELEVLTRTLPESKAIEINVGMAKFMDLILYSREQVVKENAAMGKADAQVPSTPWVIISIKFQDTDTEQPMLPITMMRNALISEGGSGVDIDREKYKASVQFWASRVEICDRDYV